MTKKKKKKSRSQYTLLSSEQLNPKLISLPLFLKITLQMLLYNRSTLYPFTVRGQHY